MAVPAYAVEYVKENGTDLHPVGRALINHARATFRQTIWRSRYPTEPWSDSLSEFRADARVPFVLACCELASTAGTTPKDAAERLLSVWVLRNGSDASPDYLFKRRHSLQALTSRDVEWAVLNLPRRKTAAAGTRFAESDREAEERDRKKREAAKLMRAQGGVR